MRKMQHALARIGSVRRWPSVMYSGGGAVATVSVGCRRTESRRRVRTKTLMAKASKLRILYCEGDADEQKATAKTFEQAGHIVEKAVGRKAVEAALKKSAFELIVLG